MLFNKNKNPSLKKDEGKKKEVREEEKPPITNADKKPSESKVKPEDVKPLPAKTVVKKLDPIESYKALVRDSGQGSKQYIEFAANVRGETLLIKGKHNPDFHREGAASLCHLCDDSYPTINEIFGGN
jgi:hypothetical protein